MSPDLFDLPDTRRPMRMWKACGAIGKGKAERRCHVYVQASRDMIATRVGKNWLATVHRARLVCVVPISWEEYARVMERAGIEIGPPLPKREWER